MLWQLKNTGIATNKKEIFSILWFFLFNNEVYLGMGWG